MKKKEIIFLTILLCTAFLFRLYRFDNPIADWHSWRQADTSAVSRNFVFHGFDFLHPHFDDLSNIPSGKDNPEGYRFVEFPLYNVAQAGVSLLFGGLTLEEWGRIVTIFSSLSSTIFLYLLVKKYSDGMTAGFAAFFYALIPYDIYYGRVILPDPSMVAATLAGIYFFDKWVERVHSSQFTVHSCSYYFLSILFVAAAFLLKPYALFFVLPIVYIAYQKWGMRLFLQWQLWIFAIVSLSPLVFWRVWMTRYPEGIPASNWLFNGNGIRFHPAFFRWILYERVIKLISGYTGIAFLLLGAYKTIHLKHQGFFLSFALSSLLYVCVIATGNVQHDYYQILIMPTIAMLYGIGATFLWTHKSRLLGLPLFRLLFIASFVSMFFYSWYIVRDYFNINNRAIMVAGAAVDRLTPKDALVMAPLDGDTSFLYQTKRRGWPSFQDGLPKMIEKGADYLVLVNPKPQDYDIGKEYKIISKAKEYILFDLHQKL